MRIAAYMPLHYQLTLGKAAHWLGPAPALPLSPHLPAMPGTLSPTARAKLQYTLDQYICMRVCIYPR